MFAACEAEEIVGAEVAFLFEEGPKLYSRLVDRLLPADAGPKIGNGSGHLVIG
jgi:hypothetical protein